MERTLPPWAQLQPAGALTTRRLSPISSSKEKTTLVMGFSPSA